MAGLNVNSIRKMFGMWRRSQKSCAKNVSQENQEEVDSRQTFKKSQWVLHKSKQRASRTRSASKDAVPPEDAVPTENAVPMEDAVLP